MERELIRWLQARVKPHPAIDLGIGDDAAVLRAARDGRIVITTDMLMDRVDFVLGEVDPRRIGRKALAVNLSDLAAMGAWPTAAFVALALPRTGGLELAKQLYDGLFPLANEFGVAIAGGDTNSWDGPLVISITAVGEVSDHGQMLRSGARPGDAILVTGSFGGSILGRHFDFTPRVREVLRLRDLHRVHAGMDVSDGLSLDLSRLCEASGCGAELDLSAVPISPDATRLAEMRCDGQTPLDHALGDGEDFELLMAVAPDEAERILTGQPLDVPITRIGQFVSEPGLWTRDASGRRVPLTPRGYEHGVT